MRLHLVSLPHTETTAEHVGCAYTQKVVKLCRMLEPRGWEIILYAGERNEAPCAEHVACLGASEREELFGPHDPNGLPIWPDDFGWALFNARAAAAVAERADVEADLLLLAGGASSQAVAQMTPRLTACEPFVGYPGIFSERCAFESYAWQHHVYAAKGISDGRWFDRVIPNYFDPAEFPKLNEGGGDYLLFLGRLVQRKGPQIAAEIAGAYGLPLLVAGAGALEAAPGRIVAPEVTVEGNVQHIGPVGWEERAELLAGARALLVPTTYIEPFGGVAVEAMMCGTPAITTDWGAFTETVPERFRFRSFQQALDAVELAGEEDGEALRDYALGRFSLEAVAPRFEEWFAALGSLWGKGWYQRRAEQVA